MGIREAFGSALDALRANKLRSALTLLGMVIGIFAVVTSVTAVDVIDAYFQDSLKLLGSSTFTISKDPVIRTGANDDREERPNVTYDQVRRLEERVSLPIAPEEYFDIGRAQFKGRRTDQGNIRVVGTNEHFLANFSRQLRAGRSLTEADVQRARAVAVITPDIASELFPAQSPLGKWVTLGGGEYKVIGVLEPKGNFLGNSFDARIYAPITHLLESYGRPERDLSRVSARAPGLATMQSAKNQVVGHMRVIRDVPPGEPNNFEVSTNETIQSTFSQFTSVLTLGGAGIGAIALLAAGVGIMNIMLVSVTERTKEIGIRKAVGAKRRHVLGQFLLEALLLCLIGGGLGIALGVLAGNGTAVYFDIGASIPWDWAVGSLVIVGVIALVFGIYPAYKAASVDPIESLRYE
jgi:ABC-type antimicrobial peptide transport system, permease component